MDINLRLEYLLHRLAKYLSDLEGQRQTGIIFLCLDGVDRLTRDAQFFGEVGLGPIELATQIAHAIFHSYLRLAMASPRLQSMISKGATQATSKRGSPAFC